MSVGSARETNMRAAVPASTGSTGDVEHDLAVDVGGIDLSHAAWRKSSYSGGNGSCVEVADLGEHIVVRDSKDKAGPKLVFDREAWRGFVEDTKTGAYDL